MNQSILLYRENGCTEPYSLKTSNFELRGNGVAIVTFNTPNNLHALTRERNQEMLLVLEHVNRCDDIKVVIWTASGDKAFCSGSSIKRDPGNSLHNDIQKEYLRKGMGIHEKTDASFVSITRAFWDCKKPIVGAINGLAVGGGANIALGNYFDIVLCSTNAKFKFPFVDIGLTPELGSSLILPFNVGMSRAKQLMYTADWFSCHIAMEWGLVNAVYSPEELLPKALELANKLADKPSSQLMLSKQLINAPLRQRLDEVLLRENETIFASKDFYGGNEVLAKFAQKLMKSKI